MLAAICIQDDEPAHLSPTQTDYNALRLEGLEYQEYTIAELESLVYPFFAVFTMECGGVVAYYGYRRKAANNINYNECLPPHGAAIYLHRCDLPLKLLIQQFEKNTAIAQRAQSFVNLMPEFKLTASSRVIGHDNDWFSRQRYTRKISDQHAYLVIVEWGDTDDATGVEIRRKMADSDRQVHKIRLWQTNPGEHDLGEQIHQHILTTIEQDIKECENLILNFMIFATEQYDTINHTREHYSICTLRTNSQLEKASYCGPVTLRGNRIYRDVAAPDTECWYLVDCHTFSGNCLTMIVDSDIEQFYPVRLTSSQDRQRIDCGKTPLAHLLKANQLGKLVDLTRVGPHDKQLIIETIKRGLISRAHRPD